MKNELFVKKEIEKIKKGLEKSTPEHKWWWNNRLYAAELFLSWIKFQKEQK